MKTNLLIGAALAGLVMVAGSVQAQDQRERPDFATLDADGDGALTREELQARGAERFAAQDSDGDGALSRAELLAGMSARMESRIDRIIEQRDQNGDGLLQEAEMTPREGGRAGRIFDRIDTNDDGSISQSEFDAIKDRTFGRRDRG